MYLKYGVFDLLQIPPGPHYVFCSSRSIYGDLAPRVGFIHYFKRQEIVVREWDNALEELKVRTRGDTELEKVRIREHLKELDTFLAPYDFSAMYKWKCLSEFITEETIKLLAPTSGVVRTCVDLLSCPDDERPRGHGVEIMSPVTRRIKQNTYFNEDDLLPNLKPIPGTAPNFTQLPDRCPKTASPEEISKHHMDAIIAVDELMSKFAKHTDLLGELQFAFVLFCCGASIDGLAHWRKLLALLSSSEIAVTKYIELYKKLLIVFRYQLPELPEELMTAGPYNSVFQDVRKLLIHCSLAGLVNEVGKVEKSLNKNMKWTFSGLLEEDPDDLPVVVEI